MDDNKLMDQMDNSILSIASISSEVAGPCDWMEKSSTTVPSQQGKDSVLVTNYSTEQQDATLKPHFSVDNKADVDAVSEACCTALEDIVPPSIMEEVSGCYTNKTLVADDIKGHECPDPRNSDQTYTIQGNVSVNFKDLRHVN